MHSESCLLTLKCQSKMIIKLILQASSFETFLYTYRYALGGSTTTNLAKLYSSLSHLCSDDFLIKVMHHASVSKFVNAKVRSDIASINGFFPHHPH